MANEEWAKDASKRAANAALRVLNGRKGFDYWWDDIPNDIRDEIVTAINEAIQKEL